ncbi:hypothetical protein [Geofilum rubicundum]|uniref:hypothetical protein n=1 Tax=Geofilum rubicundum TaxID=472113 RepID=UPI0007822AE6|nr:hypothetical protein [Geofilum rubicundum]
MTRKKTYFSPRIEIVLLDADISICMATEFTEPDPGDKPNGGATVNTFDTKEDNSGFNEDPFR